MIPGDVIVAGNWGTLPGTAQHHSHHPRHRETDDSGPKAQTTRGDTPLANYPQTLTAFHVCRQVGPLHVSFLVDTGAAVNLLRKDHANCVTIPQTPYMPLEQPLVSVDGSPLKIHGRVTQLDLPHVEIPLIPIPSTRSRAVPVSWWKILHIRPSCWLDILGDGLPTSFLSCLLPPVAERFPTRLTLTPS